MDTDEIRLELATAGDEGEITAFYLASRADALSYLPRLHTDAEVRTWIASTLMRRCRVWVARRAGLFNVVTQGAF